MCDGEVSEGEIFSTARTKKKKKKKKKTGTKIVFLTLSPFLPDLNKKLNPPRSSMNVWKNPYLVSPSLRASLSFHSLVLGFQIVARLADGHAQHALARISALAHLKILLVKLPRMCIHDLSVNMDFKKGRAKTRRMREGEGRSRKKSCNGNGKEFFEFSARSRGRTTGEPVSRDFLTSLAGSDRGKRKDLGKSNF